MHYVKIILSKYKRLSLNHIDYLEITPENKIQFLLGTNGSGKAQPLDSPIKVPNGWAKMGEMQVGTEVIAKDGTVTKVTAVHPRGRQQVFTLTFADGRKVKATLDHLWNVYIGAKQYPIVPRVLTTRQILDLLSSRTYGHLLWIDLIDSENNTDIDLPMDPYVLGVILGDGSLTSKNSLTITNPEEFIYKKISDRLSGIADVNKRTSDSLRCQVISITNPLRIRTHNSNPVLTYTRDCGLVGKKSIDKFIPDIFLKGSTRQRLDLLNGLMDTDGTIDKQGTSSYSTSSIRLAKDVQYLIRSLGGIARISIKKPFYTSNGVRIEGKLNYQINIRYKKPSELFTLPKKVCRTNDNGQYNSTLKLRITGIEFSGHEECQCISIEHPDKLYITDDFVVTHNSSVLSQITPLPAEHQDFHRGGFKIVEILHNNSRYELKSLFTEAKNRYHFIKDDVELNDGLTASTFRELVKQEFGITQDIQDILVGSQTFSMMDVSKRRNWFTRISDSDFTYALGFFSRLKEQHRDMVGALKLSQTRLLQENDKLLGPEEEAKYREEVQALTEYLSVLLEHKTPVKASSSQLDNENRLIEEQMDKLNRQFRMSYRVFSNQQGFKSAAEIESALIESMSNERTLTAQIEKLCSILEEQDKILESLKESNVGSIEDIDKTIDEHMGTLSELKSQSRLKLAFPDPEKTYGIVMSIVDQLSHVSKELVENKDRKFSRESFVQATEESVRLQVVLNKEQERNHLLTTRRKELEHFKTHNEINCPNCNHVWHQGFEEEQYRLTLLGLEDSNSKVTELERLITVNKELTDNIRNYLETYRIYANISKAWPDLNPFWSYIMENSILFDNPGSLINVIETLKGDLQIGIREEQVSKQLREALLLKQTLHNNQESSVASFVTHSEAMHNELHDLNAKLQAAKFKSQQLTSYRSSIANMEETRKALEALTAQRQTKTLEAVEQARARAINEAIEFITLEISKREQTVSKIDMQKSLIESIKVNIEEYKSNIEVLKIAMDELSPSQGLIAKGLTGFINHFVAQMNLFIRNIWLYPMELIPIVPDMEDGIDLDYKFAIRVNNNTVDDPVPDVSKGSAGMREIIDLAFKVVSMFYLGLEHSPLFLDEFGAKLDSAHKDSTQFAISNLINTTNFTQVYIVSHFENAYGNVRNADICVLHPANVKLPKDLVYNKHCKLN